jgi:putative ATP-dependent endonuclease of the OLD family
MKIKKIKVQNFRLLRDFSIDLDDDLSLIIGKNNCGKTSLLSVMDKFINYSAGNFAFDDFSIDFQTELRKAIKEDIVEESYRPIGITLKIFIEYDSGDNLANISKLMMDLNPENKTIVLLFEYVLIIDKIKKLKEDYGIFKKTKEGTKVPLELNNFLKEKHADYFQRYRKTIEYKDQRENDKNYIDLEKEKISIENLINYKFIKADRDVSNKEPDKSLSSLSSRIYKKIEADINQLAEIDKFKDALCETDVTLGSIYEVIFKKVIEKVKKFGGIKPDDTIIKITSTLQHRNLLEGNTTVMYAHDNHDLPESYNGLGYMNLICIIFEIEIKLNEFERAKTEKPADINLLFIEEPEAHTHPQMQYIFINNIKKLLKDGVNRADGEKRALQYIISTHSSHIVAESDFDNIKYLKIENDSVVAKNLKDLENEYKKNGEEQNYKFLKQYLTLHRAELFFADKAIFIEGDTERILLPAMMKKIDQEYPENPLLSQNISIIEVGNYSHIFEKFIDFIGVKSLIITDIDSATEEKTKGEDRKRRTANADATITTNASLNYFYSSNKLGDFKNKKIAEMLLKKSETDENGSKIKKWTKDKDGCLVCVYQTNEKNSEEVAYHARSFEDSFFHLNRKFVIDNKERFKSLKNIEDFEDSTIDAYDLAKNCIDKKPPFAIEILLNSKTDDSNGKQFTNWMIPDYIKKGLIWLKDQN